MGVQQVLEYRDKCVKKFQKIPIIEFSGSLINLINLEYRDFPGKITVFEFSQENPGKFRYSRLIVTIKRSRYCEDPDNQIPDIQGLAVPI